MLVEVRPLFYKGNPGHPTLDALMDLSKNTKARLGTALGLIALPLIFFHRATFSNEIFISRDILRVYYPLRKYWVERVSQLQFPDWYPYDGLGQPFPGMVISGVFHPINVLYLLMPVGSALKAVTLLSYVAAVSGAYLFARLWTLERSAALMVGVAYGLCGYMVCISNNLLYLMAASTFPWALWAAERFFRERTVGRAGVAALLLCLVLLSGDSQSFAISNGLILLLALLRPGHAPAVRALLHAGTLIALGALLSAVQLIPPLTVMKESYAGGATLEIAQRFSLHPLRIAELLAGPLFVDPGTGTSASFQMNVQLLDSPLRALWVDSIHFGAPALLLIVAALLCHRRNRATLALIGLAICFFLLALGKHTPLYELAYRFLPLWRPFRYPEKLLPYLLFLAALGSGVGLAAVQRETSLRWRMGVLGLGIAALSALVALLEWRFNLYTEGLLRPRWERPDPEVLAILGTNLVRLALQTAGALTLTSLVLIAVQRPALRVGLLVTLQLGVLYLGNEGVYHTSFPAVLERPTGFADLILEREGGPGPGKARVFTSVDEYSLPRPPGLKPMDSVTLTLAMAMEPNTSGIWKLESANTYLPAVTRRLDGLYAPRHIWLTYFAGLFSVRYVTMSAMAYEAISGKASAVLAEQPALRLLLLNNPRALPRTYLATPVCAPDDASAYTFITSKDFRAGELAMVDCPASPLPQAPPRREALGEVSVLTFEPEHVEITTRAQAPALLVLNDANYAGWSATLDGRPVPIRATNIAVRGVDVPAGEHRVVFSYRTPGLVLGAWLSLGSIGALLLAVAVTRTRRFWARQ